MAEANTVKPVRARKLRHKGRGSQVWIYLGKQLRFFINESDWKVLPMAAVIAGLVGMVIRNKFFVNMEGSLIGAFALTCTGIWNGCFNSIQAVCRERAIIKREHRSGMHVSSYVAAHMIYQFLLCAVQTGLTLYVLLLIGVPFPDQGFMTPWMVLDVGVTMLLITYAADMMSLFISSISHTTTGAMTVMPFVLIFQLVFSGGIIPLPAWSQSLSDFTISNYGVKAIAAQSGYNELPMVTGWNTLSGMRDSEVGGAVTVGQLLDLLDSPAVQKRRDTEVIPAYTVGEAQEIAGSVLESLKQSAEGEARTEPGKSADAALALGGLMNAAQPESSAGALQEQSFNEPVTLGRIVDFLKGNQALQARRDQTVTFKTTVGEIMELLGEENVKTLVQQKTAAASYKADYERSVDNIVDNWVMLVFFALVFAVLSTLALELIDKDKR